MAGTDGGVAADSGAYVGLYGYRNGVGCRAVVILTAGYGVTCSARRCYCDRLCCAVVAPTPRSASCGGKRYALALTDGGVAADGGAYVRSHSYRNGVGGGTLVGCIACHSVSCSGRRCYCDRGGCSACAPSARGAAVYRKGYRTALADCLVGGDIGADVRSHGYRNGVGGGAISVLTAGYGVTCSARRRYRNGLCSAVVAPTPRCAAGGGECHAMALTDGCVAADGGADVRLYGYRNGVGCGAFATLTAGYGVPCGARRCYRDRGARGACVPSARGAAAYRQSCRAALAYGLVRSYSSLNVGLNVNSYYVGSGAVSVLLHSYAVGGGGRGCYCDGL